MTYSRRKYQIESSCSLNRSFQFYSSSLKLMKFDFACYCFLIVKVKKITYIYLFHWSIINPYQWKKCFARRLIDCFFFIYKDNELIFTAIVKYNEILHRVLENWHSNSMRGNIFLSSFFMVLLITIYPESPISFFLVIEFTKCEIKRQ